MIVKIYEVKIEGVAPLLHHRFPEEDFGESKVTRAKAKYNPDEEARKALYADNGQTYQPANHLERSMYAAAKGFKVAGRRGKSYGSLFESSIRVTPERIPLTGAWVVDKTPVVVKQARIIRYRPRFDRWELEFQIEVASNDIDKATLKEILDTAGATVGIGDWRPKFGRFIVTKFGEQG